jgi:hypothetical protein
VELDNKSTENAVKDEKGLLMRDIMNKPACNDNLMKSPQESPYFRFLIN